MKNTQNTTKYKSIELFLLFFALPVFLATSISNYIKLPIAIIGIIYVAILLVKAKQWKTQIIGSNTRKKFWIRLIVLSLLILVLGIVILMRFDPSLLFKMPRTKPLVWISILFIYSFLSALPQELVYRKFFFMRYENLFSNRKLFLFLNVLCFSLCHLFLKNLWVIIITLLGGILFTYTYEKIRSVKWVFLEHSTYGYLVFTVGLGTMLAFPE